MSRLEIGDILEGRYRVDQPIARGGMSTVYRCVDMRLGRAVAAKVMHDHYADDPVFVHRFEREARAMAQLTHPNLVGVHDFSSESDPIFLIMELITGGTLRELLAERGPMPPHAAAAVMRAMLTGLSAVHAHGLVHRDIKPDNVLINADHRVKLGDFGLVRATRSATVTSNNIVGTVSYLSPEQVDGSTITPASDVYSAGVVLFELLTGTVPFSGDSDLAHAMARLREDVPAPSSRIAGVPALFDELVATATTRSVSERFADAAEFLAALDDVSAELHLPAFTVPVPKNSAAARTAAKPTNMAGIGATDIFEPTSVFENKSFHAATDEAGADDDSESPTEFLGSDDHTEMLQPRHEYHDSRREPLSFETRVDNPRPAVAPPVLPPVAPPAPPLGTYDPRRDQWGQSPHSFGARREDINASPGGVPGVAQEEYYPPQHHEDHSIASADEEPAPRLVTNRSPITLTLWIMAVAALTLIVAVGGWWFGSGMYGLMPSLLE